MPDEAEDEPEVTGDEAATANDDTRHDAPGVQRQRRERLLVII